MDGSAVAVADLDDPPPGEGAARSAAPSGRPGRCAGGRVVAAVAVLLLAGAGAASHTRASSAERTLARHQAHALWVGPPSVTSVPGARPAAGWLPVAVAVTVFDRGDVPLDLRVTGVDAPHQRTTRAPPPVRVQPGMAATASLLVRVECAAVREPPRSVLLAEPRTAVRVDVDGVPARLVVLGGVAGSPVTLTQQLWSVCHLGTSA